MRKVIVIGLAIIGLFVFWANKPSKLHDKIAYYKKKSIYTQVAKISGDLDFSTGCASIKNGEDDIILLIFPDEVKVREIDSETWKFDDKILTVGDTVLFTGGYRELSRLDLEKVIIPSEECLTGVVAFVGLLSSESNITNYIVKMFT